MHFSALALAPSYCSKHRVTSQGWNYPAPRGEDTMDREFTADLSSQLPYHPPPEGFRMSSDSSSDADSRYLPNTYIYKILDTYIHKYVKVCNSLDNTMS